MAENYKRLCGLRIASFKLKCHGMGLVSVGADSSR